MIKSLLKKVKIGNDIKVHHLKAFQIGRVGSKPIYHPDVLEMIKKEQFSRSNDSRSSGSSAENSSLSSNSETPNISQQNRNTVNHKNELKIDSSRKVRRRLESCVPTIVIDLSVFLCQSNQ